MGQKLQLLDSHHGPSLVGRLMSEENKYDTNGDASHLWSSRNLYSEALMVYTDDLAICRIHTLVVDDALIAYFGFSPARHDEIMSISLLARFSN